MTTTTLTESPTPQRLRMYQRFFSLNNRYLPPFLITCILLAGQLGFGFLESYSRTALAIACGIVMEMVLSRLIVGKWPHLASAYITGISVGILIRSPAFWPYAMCSMISITSKYAIRWRGQHLYNPSNLGVSAMLFLAPTTVAALSVQWGNTVWPMIVIWCLGTFIVWRLKRLHICVTYIISFLLFSFVRSLVTGKPWLGEVSPITGPMYQLFILFMITDPKTTVRSYWGQCVVVFIVALVEMLLRLNRVVQAPFYALFLVGPVALLLELWWKSRRAGPAAIPPA
ncbi:MAG: hypothetical protein ABI353_12505 [Isosphaeraceae bacterium]